jgi:hypothetical protein
MNVIEIFVNAHPLWAAFVGGMVVAMITRRRKS